MKCGSTEFHQLMKGGVYYVYTHRRPDGRLFYIGKGVGDRAVDFYKRGSYHNRITKKWGRENLLIDAYPTHDERHAYAVERQLILANRKAGVTLANVDDGGIGRIGVFIGPEHRRKISAALKGHPVSPEARAKISAAGRGRIASPETREKLSRKKLSEAHKAILAEVSSKRVRGEEERAKARAKMTGRKLTEEHRQKLSESHKGKKQPPELVAKRAAAIRAVFAERREMQAARKAGDV